MSEEQTLIASIRAFAKEHGYHLRETNLAQTVKGLIARKQKYGKAYCPCRRVKPEDPAYCQKIECPCTYVHTEVVTKGHCQCMLYWAKEAQE